MSRWWQNRPLRLRLALAQTALAAATGLLCLLGMMASGSPPTGTAHEILAALALGAVTLLVFAILSYAIAGRVLRPLREMAQQMRNLPLRSLSEPIPVSHPEDELGQLAAGLNGTLARLADASARLDRLVADVSHELRTPLTAMKAVGEVALREANPAVLHDAVGSMLEEIGRMNHLLERLLLLTRPGDEEMPVELEAGLVRPSLLEVCDSLSLVAEEKQQRLEVDCPDHLLAVFDPALLRLVLMNLAQNAIRYSPPRKPIHLRAMGGDGVVVIEVADEGPGIAPEHQEKIFERFYRVDKARSRADGGAGLGLAIVKWAVERMGGSVELRSQPGRGSVFGLRLRTIHP
jgi:signal transduction histidine kinase